TPEPLLDLGHHPAADHPGADPPVQHEQEQHDAQEHADRGPADEEPPTSHRALIARRPGLQWPALELLYVDVDVDLDVVVNVDLDGDGAVNLDTTLDGPDVRVARVNGGADVHVAVAVNVQVNVDVYVGCYGAVQDTATM